MIILLVLHLILSYKYIILQLGFSTKILTRYGPAVSYLSFLGISSKYESINLNQIGEYFAFLLSFKLANFVLNWLH